MMRNLVNFNVSSAKSENLLFDVLNLLIAYKVSAKKVVQKSYLSWPLMWILTIAVGSLKIYTLMGYFYWKYVIFELKNTEEWCCEKWLMVSKLTYEIWWMFTKVLESNVRPSVYVLAERMYILDKSNHSHFTFLVFPLFAWSCPNSSCNFWNQESVLYKFCTIM